jgi:hypothetical protein
MNIARFAAALLGLALLAAGCGQKGPLYIEAPPPKPQPTAPAKKKAKAVQPAPTAPTAPTQTPEPAQPDQPDANLPADTQTTQP